MQQQESKLKAILQHKGSISRCCFFIHSKPEKYQDRNNIDFSKMIFKNQIIAIGMIFWNIKIIYYINTI